MGSKKTPVLAMEETASVYVISTICDGIAGAPVKVGISLAPHARLPTLQSASPHELRIFRIFNMPSLKIARDVERCFHEMNADKRMKGEWFNIEPEKAVSLLTLQVTWMLDLLTNLSTGGKKEALKLIGIEGT